MHYPTDNNSNTINTPPTVSLPNTPVCQNYDAYIFLLSEGIGSLEQSFDTQLQNLTQMSLVKSNSKETNANSESDIESIESLQHTIHILKKELINKENTINNMSIILKKITSNIYNVSPLNKEFGNELILENNTDHIDSKNEIVHELLDVEFEHLQRRYQHLLDQSTNQPDQTFGNDQCSNDSNEFNIQNQELNKVTPPLNKVPSCEEQLTEIH